jgi:hypothetical protein
VEWSGAAYLAIDVNRYSGHTDGDAGVDLEGNANGRVCVFVHREKTSKGCKLFQELMLTKGEIEICHDGETSRSKT